MTELDAPDDLAYVVAPGIAAFVRGSDGMELVSASAVWRMPTSSTLLVLRIFSVRRSRAEALALVPAIDRPTLGRLIDGAYANGFLIRDDGSNVAATGAAQWLEPHDALFHRQSRTRLAGHLVGPRSAYLPLSHFGGEGATRDDEPPSSSLPAPDAVAGARLRDVSLADALASRRTRYSERPVPLESLANLLYFSSRTTHTEPGDAWPEIRQRPYPSGGGLHSLTIYIVARDCPGLSRGLYRYDARRHAVSAVSAWNDALDRLIADAGFTTGGQSPHPPVLLIAAADVRVVVAKYQGIAYSLILKEVGAWLQTVYLVANALELAPAAIGFGDASVFAALLAGQGRHDLSVGDIIIGG